MGDRHATRNGVSDGVARRGAVESDVDSLELPQRITPVNASALPRDRLAD